MLRESGTGEIQNRDRLSRNYNALTTRPPGHTSPCTVMNTVIITVVVVVVVAASRRCSHSSPKVRRSRSPRAGRVSQVGSGTFRVYTSIVLWVETIRVPRAKGAGRRAIITYARRVSV